MRYISIWQGKIIIQLTWSGDKDKVPELLINFLSEKRFNYDENNNDITKSKRGKKLKIESGSSVSLENLNALIWGIGKKFKGQWEEKNPNHKKHFTDQNGDKFGKFIIHKMLKIIGFNFYTRIEKYKYTSQCSSTHHSLIFYGWIFTIFIIHKRICP